MSTDSLSISSHKKSGFRMTEITIKNRSIPSELDNYILVQLSDPHFGVYTSQEVIEKSINLCNSLDPDTILLTGDYVHAGRQEVRTMMFRVLGPALSRYRQYRRLARYSAIDFSALLSELSPKEHTIGVWGNHDYLEGKRTLKKFLPQNIIWLENETIHLSARGHLIRISGIDDFRFGKPDIKKTISALVPDTNSEISDKLREPVFSLFLSHNPDTVTLPGNELLGEYDLMLCGHTHGGQICLPGSIPLKTETRQRKIRKGSSRFENLPVYVSNGIGCSGLPFRTFCPPEIVSVRLLSCQ